VLDFQQLAVLLLVFVRISAFTATAPFFSIQGVSGLAKVGFAVVLTITVLPFVPAEMGPPGSLWSFMIFVAAETFIGLLLGFTATLIFQAVKVGGELIDVQMGFAMASVLDPLNGTRVTLMGEFLYIYALLLFFTFNGHHSLIMAVAKSFQLVPLGAGALSGVMMQQLVNIFVGMFAVAFKIAAPVMAVLIISDISLGLVARTVPQLNVFILGFPLKAGLGMLVVALILPLLAGIVTDLITQMEKDIILIMGSFS